MNINECMEFINSYSKSGGHITDLSRAENLMKLIGNPEKKLKFVHVAGTNGKGSTVEYISNALIYSGYKTGQFTSPYILRYNDRIRINGTEIDDNSLCEICGLIREKIDDKPYSQFEITMAIAFLWYVREECDIVVLETGIGGLLDCTNVIPPPLLSVITSISIDHTDILGDTVEKIAVHKAGIIKENSAFIISQNNSYFVKNIVIEIGRNNGARHIKSEWVNDWQSDYRYFTYKGERFTPAMYGNAQKMNAITAIDACNYLKQKNFKISDENIRKSIETTVVKGRIQFIENEVKTIVDGGHNPAGVESLADILRMFYDNGWGIYVVMGMVDSKDYTESVGFVAEYASKIFTVDNFAPNAVPAEKLAEIARLKANPDAELPEYCHSLAKAIEKVRKIAIAGQDIIVICGSLYLASEYLNNFGK